jgi:peptidoglycan/LPS O-acetylase OafA/YrhL
LFCGHVGVDVFFVISGFILTYVHFRDFDQPRTIPSYLYKRVCRIYPALVIMTLFVLATYGLGYKPSSEGKLAPYEVLSSFLLLPQRGFPLVGVAWTLKYEILFYAVFALFLLRSWLGMIVLLLWQGACLVVELQQWPLPFPWDFYLAPLSIEFLLGVVVALATFALQKRPRAGFAIGAALLGLLGVALLFGEDVARALRGVAAENSGKPMPTLQWLVAIGATLIVLSVNAAEISGWLRVNRLALLLGDASYSIYLVHYAVIAFLGKTLRKLPIAWSQGQTVLAMIAMAAVATCAGVAFHRLVDKPIQRFLRRFAPKSDSPA